MHGDICIPCAYSVMAAANQSYSIYMYIYAWSVHIVLWLRHAQFYMQDVFLTAAMQLYVYMHYSECVYVQCYDCRYVALCVHAWCLYMYSTYVQYSAMTAAM